MKNIRTYMFASFFFFVALYAEAQVDVTIYEIQYVDPAGGTDDSPYNFQTVTTTGVVTASGESNNLDAVFIQQEGLTEWAGLRLKSGVGLGTLEVGDVVTVTGDVGEDSGFTVITFVTAIEVIGTSTISPVVLAPEVFTSYSLAGTEKYEGMLIELKNPSGNLSVVNTNPDTPSNFGDWRVGSDPMNADAGCRILTGRQTSSDFSSLNVSYINDLVWATNSGTMNVPPIVVNNGDEFVAIRGIMHYGFGDMRLLPRNNDDCDAPPANDDCTDAIALDLGTETSIDNTGATDSGIVGTCDSGVISDIWYSFVGTATGEVYIDAGTAQVSIFDDCTGTTEIACNPGNNVAVTGLTNGTTYYLRITDDGTTTRVPGAFTLIINDVTLGLEDEVFNSFKYFPNPTQGTLSLRAQDNIQAVSVYNMIGQEVLHAKPNSLTDELDLSGLNTGAYFLKVRINHAEENFRIIKE